jgi:hypothetical protein
VKRAIATIAGLAEHERVAPPQMTRGLRRAPRAPDIVETISDRGQGPAFPFLALRLSTSFLNTVHLNIRFMGFWHHRRGVLPVPDESMQIRTSCATGPATKEVLATLAATMGAARADAVVAFYDCRHDAAAIHAFLTERFPGVPVIGGSSNGGVMDGMALHDHGIGLWLLNDPHGDYGAAVTDKGTDPAAAAEGALRRAIAATGCEGQLPDLIWIYQAPGGEEAVLDGLRRVVGDRCPIVGGSSADNDLSGRWTQIGPEGVATAGLAVMAFFPNGETGVLFRGGYEPRGISGRVTSVSATPDGPRDRGPGRIIHEIDGRPAASVYDEWIGGGIAQHLDDGGFILADTTMFPLGMLTGEIGGVPQYLLIHPEAVLRGGAITTFADVPPGAELHVMTGARELLVERAGAVARQARLPELGDGPPAGALVVFCGGCRMAVADAQEGVPATIGGALQGAPFLGCFTFGEQGPIGARNVHGNLMVSAVVFG